MCDDGRPSTAARKLVHGQNHAHAQTNPNRANPEEDRKPLPPKDLLISEQDRKVTPNQNRHHIGDLTLSARTFYISFAKFTLPNLTGAVLPPCGSLQWL